MYEHYIRTDREGRIIAGFSTFDRQPDAGDILLRADGGKHFELFGNDRNRPLSFYPTESDREVFLYKYENGQVAVRTQVELLPDLPANAPVESIEDRLSILEARLADVEAALPAAF